MVLSDIEAAVRDKLSDTAFEASLIDNAANWYVNELCMNTRLCIMEENAVLTASAGDTTVDLPSDLQTLIKDGMYITSPSIYDFFQYQMSYRDFMRQYPGFAGYTASLPYQWTDFNNQIRLSAPLSVDISINCDYLRKPVIMVEEDDTCEIPDLYQEMVVLGTLIRCMQTNEDYGEASNEAVKLSELTTAFIRNEGRGQIQTGPQIIGSNRRGRGSSQNQSNGGYSAADF